jgi:hypothetical protein
VCVSRGLERRAAPNTWFRVLPAQDQSPWLDTVRLRGDFRSLRAERIQRPTRRDRVARY